MSTYKNFTVDLPKRIAELDFRFREIALCADLEVSYLLMKLAASFLLPYERIEGTSGAWRADVKDRQSLRKHFELDKLFCESTYCSSIELWESIDVDNFSHGPRAWRGNEQAFNWPVHRVLETIRHSVAHSNLFFGGEQIIEHVYLGSRKGRDPKNEKYRVVCCTVVELQHLVDAWITNLQELDVSPSLIWYEIENAA